MNHTVQENKANDHHRQNVLMYDQILSTNTILHIWRTVRRICMLILGLKGLQLMGQVIETKSKLDSGVVSF